MRLLVILVILLPANIQAAAWITATGTDKRLIIYLHTETILLDISYDDIGVNAFAGPRQTREIDCPE